MSVILSSDSLLSMRNVVHIIGCLVRLMSVSVTEFSDILSQPCA